VGGYVNEHSLYDGLFGNIYHNYKSLHLVQLVDPFCEYIDRTVHEENSRCTYLFVGVLKIMTNDWNESRYIFIGD
jgi:hypothetical protein